MLCMKNARHIRQANTAGPATHEAAVAAVLVAHASRWHRMPGTHVVATTCFTS